MSGGDDAEFFGQFERAVKFGVVNAERAFVSQEDLETELMPRLTISRNS